MYADGASELPIVVRVFVLDCRNYFRASDLGRKIAEFSVTIRHIRTVAVASRRHNGDAAALDVDQSVTHIKHRFNAAIGDFELSRADDGNTRNRAAHDPFSAARRVER